MQELLRLKRGKAAKSIVSVFSSSTILLFNILQAMKVNSWSRKIYWFKKLDYLFSKYIHKKNLHLVIESTLDENQSHLHGN